MYILYLMVKSKYFWFCMLIILALLYFYLSNNKNINNSPEGFHQKRPFVLKTDSDIYDEFYVDIYDKLHIPGERAEFAYNTIIDATMPNKMTSNFLDVGSGTGDLVNILTKSGYSAHGIDKSLAMVNCSKKKYPTIDIECGCMSSGATYDKNTFSHITCTDFTFYHMENKLDFFRKCYNWLIPNGYLILHLVDNHNFTPAVSCVEKMLDINFSKDAALKNINNTNVDFGDFNYNVTYKSGNESDNIIVKETFTDNASKHIRQNENTLFIEEIKDTLTNATKCGYIAHSYFSLPNDKHQFVYIFERVG